MNRRELIRAVAAQTAQDAKLVESVISGATDVITAVVAKGEAVTVQGFAKFAKVERAARMGRNPRTGEQIRIKASKRVRVSPMKAFKDMVMSPAQAPRLDRGVWPTSPDLLAKQASARKEAAATARPSARATAAAGRTTTKKAAARPAAKKTTAKKAPAKRTTAKKAPTRPAARKTTAKKAPAKRTTAKRTAAKKTARR
jgi:DNA-binding protein HU-beta